MTTDDAEEIVDLVMEELPDEICEALGGVQVYSVQGRGDREVKAAIKFAGLPRARIEPDFRGLFLGQVAAKGEPAAGSIVLNCEVLDGTDDVRSTLAHEIGHALGLSEAEVEDLGLG